MMPESPRWLVSEGRYDDARGIFRQIGKYNGLTEEQLEEGIDKHKFDGEIEEAQPVQPIENNGSRRGLKAPVLASYAGSSNKQLRKDMRNSNFISQSF